MHGHVTRADTLWHGGPTPMAGKMKASQSMTNQMLTIMFADIEGFSTVPPHPRCSVPFFHLVPEWAAAPICEAIPAEELAEVCTQYFEVMCSIHGPPRLWLPTRHAVRVPVRQHPNKTLRPSGDGSVHISQN